MCVMSARMRVVEQGGVGGGSGYQIIILNRIRFQWMSRMKESLLTYTK